MKIQNFHDSGHEFLSNFYPCKINLGLLTFPSAEHAYQASKTLIPGEKIKFTNPLISASGAKRLGQKITLREDWDKVKLEVMEDILIEKFNDEELKLKLLETGDNELEEGNWWGDTYWGVCKGVGENHLGKLLMKVRENLKNG